MKFEGKDLYFLVSFPYGENCTTGEPHPRTGYYDRACKLKAFKSKSEALKAQCIDQDLIGSKRALRELNLGMNLNKFDELMHYYYMQAYSI